MVMAVEPAWVLAGSMNYFGNKRATLGTSNPLQAIPNTVVQDRLREFNSEERGRARLGHSPRNHAKELMRDYGSMQTTADGGLSEHLKAKSKEDNAELMRLMDPALQRLFHQDGFPTTLCHYPDFAGLKGILETGSLWATYEKVLNDTTEHSYGGALTEYLRGKVSDEVFPHTQRAAANPLRNFVACFCERSDVLSMWRSYAAFGGGYCLEFGGRELLGCSFPPYTARLPFKMAYGPELSQHIRDLLDVLVEFSARGPLEAIAAGGWLSLFALKFKHPAFQEERERRIVIRDPDISLLKFRVGLMDIKPYIELCAVMSEGAKRLLPAEEGFIWSRHFGMMRRLSKPSA